MNDDKNNPNDDDWGMTMPHMRYQEKQEKKKSETFSDDFLLELEGPQNPPSNDDWGMTTPNLNVPNQYSSSSANDSDFDKTTPNLNIPRDSYDNSSKNSTSDDDWGMTSDLKQPNNYSSSSSNSSDFDKTAPNLNVPQYSWEEKTPPSNPLPDDDWGMTTPNINLPQANQPRNNAESWEMSAPDFNPPPVAPPKKNEWSMPAPVFRVSEGENIEDIKKTAAFKLSDLQGFDMNTKDFKPSESSSPAPSSFDQTAPSFDFHENKPPSVSANSASAFSAAPTANLPNNFSDVPPVASEPPSSNPSIAAAAPPEKKSKSKVPLIVGGLFAMMLFAGVSLAAAYFFLIRKPVETASKISSSEPETASNTSAPPAPIVAAPTAAPSSDLPKEVELKGAMVLVPAGEFTMGSDTGADESKPAHTVDLPAYYIDKTEVTNAEYKAFCDATGKSYPPNPHIEKDYFTARPNAPVVGVSFADAKAYAEWAGKRLPTEEEWEKAASWDEATKTKREFPWGNSFDKSDAAFGLKKISDVGKFSGGASPVGAMDMAGNVLEWVDAYFQPYPNSTISNSEFGETNRVVRGGHFASKSSDSLKTTKRIYIPPTVASGEDDEKLVAAIIGFRCAVSADSPSVAEVLRGQGK